jgi:AraC-like DNA-binding protein
MSDDADSIAVAPVHLDSMLQQVRQAYVRDDLPATLDMATRGSLVAKRTGMTACGAMFDFYYGICQTWLGQEAEGLERMLDALKVIDSAGDTASVRFRPFCYKELASAHIALEDLDAAVSDCLARQDAIETARNSGASPAQVDAWTGSNAIMLATLYDFTGNEAQGRQWLQRFHQTEYAKSAKGAHGLLDYYNSTDQAQAYIETFRQAKSYFGPDTLNLRYRDEMMYLINAYHTLGDMDGMADAIERVVALNDSVMNRTVRSNSLKLQEQYKVKMARLEVEQGRNRARRNMRLGLGILVAMLVVIAFLLRFNLRMQRKNRVLARQVNKVDELERQLVQRQRGRNQKEDAVTDEELEERLNEWLDADDHFLSKVTIQEAAASLRVTQKRITEMLEAMGKYRNLEEWATHKRVSRACTLILSHPEYTIESIAADAGFSSPRTFYRKFQAETGLSPTEYRQAVAQNAPAPRPSAEEDA